MKSIEYILLWALCLFRLDPLEAACPNLCNNNGLCGINNVCICHEGFTGPDCSRRICPYGVSWADKTTAIDTAHADSECSGAGICDSARGECRCFDGFTGHACQRSTCHNNCNNRGQCLSMADMAVYYGQDYDPTALSAGDGLGPVYTNWEKTSMMTCKCDYGFFGPDCSLVMCPKGDDPVTVNQVSRQIRLLVVDGGDTGYFTGHLGVTFQGSTSFLTLGSPSSQNCEEILESNPKFGDVTCNYTSNSSTTRWFDITFNSWPTLPKENNLYSHTGNPANTDFLCDVSKTDSTVRCTFTDLVTTNLREYEYCSNRGSCDFTTGNCLCATGFGGINCGLTHTEYFQSANARVYQEVEVKSSDFKSTAINIVTAKSSASDFKLLEASSNSKSFSVRGDGDVAADSLRIVESGLSITKGGVMVEKGGLNVTTDGVVVTNAETASPVVGVQSTDALFDDTVLDVRAMGTSPQQHYLLKAMNQDFTRFSVRGDGLVGIDDSGLHVTGGITLNGGGLTAKGGVTIFDGGLTVTGGVTILSGDVTISDGVDVLDSGLRVSEGTTISTVGLVISQGGLGVELAGETISAGGVVVSAGGATIASGGLVVTGGATVQSGGMKTTDGGTVHTGGLKVSDGLSVVTSGTKVRPGANFYGVEIVADGLIVRSSGLSIHNGGMKVTGGTSVASSGLVIEDGGATVVAVGTKVTGGANVYTGGVHVLADGLQVTAGLSARSSGMKVTAGITVLSSGATAVGGATVLLGGLKVTAGITVPNGGLNVELGSMKVTGGASVLSSGVNIIGSGLTVTNSGLVVSANGGTITAGGMKVSGGLSILSGVSHVDLAGITATGGLSVGSGGAKVTGGLTIIDAGLYVVNSGMTLAGGATVVGGASVESGGLFVHASGAQVTGVTDIQDVGLTVPSGLSLTIANTGLFVGAGGGTVNAGGLKVAGGTTISTVGVDVDVGGVNVAGGVSVQDTGMKVAAGLTLVDTGLVVLANGATISSGGMDVSGAVTVADVGVNVDATGTDTTGGFSVQNLGATVTGGMTIANTGVVVTANGMTVAGGLKVAGGLTVDSSNLVVGQNMQVGGTWRVNTGATVETGLTVRNSNLRVDAGGATIVGNVYVGGSLTIVNTLFASGHTLTSDRRLKKNIEPLRNNLESVTKLRGIYFNWREDSVFGNKTRRQIGVIAQDVQAVFPEATTPVLDEEYLGVDYSQLIPVLIEAIRELRDNHQELSDTYDELYARTEDCEVVDVSNY